MSRTHQTSLQRLQRALPFAFLAILAILACERRPRDADLKRELLARIAEDQRVRDGFVRDLQQRGRPSETTARAMLATDSANLLWFKPLVQRYGLPTRAQVGKEGVEAAFLLIQHADRDPDFQEAMLPLLEKAYAAGEVPGDALGMLTDRVLKARGRPQRFGTQMTGRDGKMVMDSVEDPANLDQRRAKLGMTPMARYRELIDSMFAQRPSGTAPAPAPK